MRALKNTWTLLAFALVLVGCASLGNEPAQSFKQRLAYAEGVHTAVLDATTSSLNAGTISSAEAQSVATKADEAQVVLEAAKTAYAAGDVEGADSKLAIALTALQTLQDYLRSHGGAK